MVCWSGLRDQRDTKISNVKQRDQETPTARFWYCFLLCSLCLLSFLTAAAAEARPGAAKDTPAPYVCANGPTPRTPALVKITGALTTIMAIQTPNPTPCIPSDHNPTSSLSSTHLLLPLPLLLAPPLPFPPFLDPRHTSALLLPPIGRRRRRSGVLALLADVDVVHGVGVLGVRGGGGDGGDGGLGWYLCVWVIGLGKKEDEMKCVA